MSKITQGEYTKQEILTALDSKDLSNAKRTLTKLGYSYTTNNKRGSSYRLIINSVPVDTAAAETFRKCCKDDLGITENIDFNKLAILICFLEYDTNFVDLTLEQMESRIKDKGFIITRKTIAKYLEILANNDILVTFLDYVYYLPLDRTKFITKEEWLRYWDTYYKCGVCTLERTPKRRYNRYFGNALIPSYKTLVNTATTVVKEIVNNDSV